MIAASRRTALLTAARPARVAVVAAVFPRQFSNGNVPPKPPSAASRERAEFKEAQLPKDNIEFKETGLLTTIDRLANIMFMAEIFRALWLSAEVKQKTPSREKFSQVQLPAVQQYRKRLARLTATRMGGVGGRWFELASS